VAVKTGRKSKLDDQMIEDICDGIRAGLTQEQAAIQAGIHEATFYRWVKLGQKAKAGMFCKFFQSLKKAQVEARQTHLGRISKASEGNQLVHERRVKKDAAGNIVEITLVSKVLPPQWQASAWILERRFPDEFGKHIQPGKPEERDPFDTWIESLMEAEAQFGDLELTEKD